MQTKILLTRQWPSAVEDYLRSRYDVTFNTSNTPLTEAQLRDATCNVDVLCTTVADQITATVLSEVNSKVRLICNFGVGFEHIDLAACKTRNIMVTNTPDVVTAATAEAAILLLLMIARRAGEGERMLRSTKCTDGKSIHILGTQSIGKTLGLIGFGRIGQAAAAIASKGLGMKILYHSRHRVDGLIEKQSSADYCANIDDLLAASDFVSLHCPGGAATENMINTQRLAKMKPSAFLINTARGSVIDETALINALHNGTIAGAGLDVYCNEPNVRADLVAAPNVVLLPHIGTATVETRYEMGMRAVRNLEQWLAGREPPDRVA